MTAPAPGPEAVGTTADRARLRDLWPLLRGQRTAIVIGFALSVLSSATAVGQPIAMMLVINATLEQRPIISPLLLLALLLFADVGLTALQSTVTLRAGESIVFEVRERLIGRIMLWPGAGYRRHRRGDIVSRVTNDAGSLRSVIADGTVDVAGSLLTLAGGIIVMITIDWLLFAVSAAVVCVSAAAVWAFLGRITTAAEHAQSHLGTLSAELDRTLSSPLTMILSGTRHVEAARLRAHAQRSCAAGKQAAIWDALVAPVLMFGANLAFLAVFGLGGVRVASGSLVIAEFVSFVLYFGVLVSPLFSSFHALSTIQRALGSLRRIEVMLAEPIDESEPPSTRTGHSPPLPDSAPDATAAVIDSQPPPRVRCEGLRFRYDPGRPPVIDGLNLSVRAGSWTALTGGSGTGKTTLLHLIAGLEQAESGTIRIGSRRLDALSPGDRRRLIACVLQEAPVFYGRLRDNLTYGLADPPGDAQLRAVAAQAGLATLLEQLPAGLDAHIAEDGVSLSGGERQRISLARALLRRPRVLLLDEPTSQLDAANERLVLSTLTQLRGQMTILMTAHRATTAAAADAVIDLAELQHT